MTVNDSVFFGHMPLYFQLAELIKQKIATGEYAPHTSLPSEPEMMSLYDVSRLTVRAALDTLLKQQLIYKRQGKGTFVSDPPKRCPCCGQVLPAEKQPKEEVAS